MRHVRARIRRLAAAFSANRHEAELADELESHLQMHIDDNLRAGMTPAAARREAMVRLGGIEQVKEQYRDRRGIPFLQHLARDVRFGARMLRKSPTFTIAAIVTLGLGIGVNTAIFSVVNAVLLRPLPFPRADRLALVWATNTKTGDREDVASYPDFESWKTQSRSFQAMAAFTTRGVVLTGGRHPEVAPAVQVTPGFFELLGVPIALGRAFVSGDDVPGAPSVALLSDRAWKEYFGGRADVLGQTILANEEPRTIVGVLPPGFNFSPGELEQIYLPIPREASRNHGFLRVIGRLSDDADVQSGQAELDVIAGRVAGQYPRTNANVGVNIVPLVDALVGGQLRTRLLIFLGVVALVLLIACTNVANLVLARNASRDRELSLRLALGAGRWRLFQQLLTESVLLALAGGALALLFANWGTRLLVAVLANSVPIPRIEHSRMDGWVLIFTLAVSVATGILFGIVPALMATPPDLNSSLRESTRSVTANVRGRRVRALLMVAETALALVLLAGAGLLLKTLATLRSTSPGFSTTDVLAVDFSLPAKKFAAQEERTRFVSDLITRLGSLTGVSSAAVVADLPLNGGSDSLQFQVVGRPTDKPSSANFNIVSAGYFRTLSIPVRTGREFTADDTLGSLPVVVINETAARRFWPGEDPIGRQISLRPGATHTVVGITGDVRQSSLGAAPKPEIFLNALQPGPGWPWLTLVVRTNPDAPILADPIKDVVAAADRDVPIVRIRPLEDMLAGTLAQPRVYTMLIGAFAALAVALAAIGLYGVVSYSVAQRTHELGIRLALGARRADVIRLVLQQGTLYTAAGVVLGVSGAVAFMRVLAGLIPGAQPRDFVILGEVSGLLVLVGLAASYVPARRGARVDPIVALRSE